MKNFFLLILIIGFTGNISCFSQKTQRGFKVVKELEDNEGFKAYNKKYAMVIGIDSYENGIQPLSYAVADAKAIKSMFEDNLGFDEVIMLENSQGSRREILRNISLLRSKMVEEDQFFFYFAGHGISYGDANSEIGFLVTHNASGFSREDIEIDGISMTDLRERLVKLPAKHVLLAIDACYGGYAAVTSRSLPDETLNYLKIISKSRSRQIITAGKRGQEVQESPEWGHSAFTYKLLDAINKELADGDRNGIITATELYSYLSPSVTTLTSGFQTPQYARLTGDEGEFIFILESEEEPMPVEVKPENNVVVEVGEVKSLTGTLEITSYIDGKLYVDGEFLTDVKNGTMVPISGIKPGKRNVSIQNDDGEWKKLAYVITNQTTQLIAQDIVPKPKPVVTAKVTNEPSENVVLVNNTNTKENNYPEGYAINVNKEGKYHKISSKYNFSVWFDNIHWTVPKYNLSNSAEMQFATYNDEAWGMVIAEDGEFNTESLKDAVIENAKKVCKKVKLVKSEKKLINGKEMLQIEVHADISGIAFVYFGNLYTNGKYAVQFLSYTSKASFPKYKSVMNELISGIEIE
ncbi:caspase family protein [Chondrinema litorale]|uniref:caspase family protein n=1 Tax=Chondrinema litorale TaxID=2994555 RepID=UPI002542D8FB|nr:caspase family protein [Chondrinema litorale]UZR94546.1 caspase family protein [Chondrinema litorale]